METAKELAIGFLERHGLTGTITLYFDGACEPRNPGGVATGGWIVRRPDVGLEIQEHAMFYDGGPQATNNVAEWCALGKGLAALTTHRNLCMECELEIYGDSQLVVYQLLGKWNCNKPHLQKLRSRCHEILESLPLRKWSAMWIPREENHEADALSRRAYVEYTRNAFPERHTHGRR